MYGDILNSLITSFRKILLYFPKALRRNAGEMYNQHVLTQAEVELFSNDAVIWG